MHKTQFVLLLIMATLNMACGQSESDSSVKQDEHTTDWKTLIEDEYQISYPADWELNQSGQMGTSFLILSPLSDEADNFRENVNLLVQDLSAYDLTLDQYVELSEQQVKSLVTDATIISSERIQKEGKEFQKFIYSGKQGIYYLTFEQYCWVTEDAAYVLTLTCKVDEFEQYQPVGEKILDSFHFN